MNIFLKVMLVSLISGTILFLTSCQETSSPNTDGDKGIAVFNTSIGGQLALSEGYELNVPAGAVPSKQDGTDGEITFSIETIGNQSDLPVEIPSRYSLISNVVNFGPVGFIFEIPINFYIPAASAETAEGLVILWFNSNSEMWEQIPISNIDEAGKRLGGSSIELGYFAVAYDNTLQQLNPKTDEISVIRKQGGIWFYHGNPVSGPPFGTANSEYYFSMTITDVQFKFPEQESLRSSLVGRVASTWVVNIGSGNARLDNKTTFSYLPQGEYTVVFSRKIKTQSLGMPGPLETYSMPATVDVNEYTGNIGWGYDFTRESGWSKVTLPEGGSWGQNRPSDWGTPTVPYGTGQFQATLTWNTNTLCSTDLDLHLYGPNDVHVYFRGKQSSCGSLELDRDWLQTPYGNAVENIYSIADMPSGEYKLSVHHYSGCTPKNFEVRVIRGGSSTTYSKTATVNKDYTEIVTFRL